MKRGNILVIDENEVWRDHVTQALRLRGHSVSATTTIAEATRTLDRQAPDLLIIDIDLPALAGLTFLERLSMMSFPASRVIVFTYQRNARIRDAIRRLGVESYLLKNECAAPEVIHCVEAKLDCMDGRPRG